MTTQALILAGLVPALKMAGYLVPFIGLALGESYQDDDDARYKYVTVDDLGTEQFTD